MFGDAYEHHNENYGDDVEYGYDQEHGDHDGNDDNSDGHKHDIARVTTVYFK